MSTFTELGTRVDNVQIFLIFMMVFWFIACNAVLVYFMLKYRRKSSDEVTPDFKGNHTLEIVWTVVPTILCIIIFFYGIQVWEDLQTPPADAMDIQVRAQKWSWTFEYDGGRITGGDLYVPEGKPVRLVMKSNDVLHSMFIPEFRVKEDVTPSMYTYLWFQGDVAGTYNIFCTEYCGKDHSAMLGKVHVLDMETWERFEKNLPLDPNETPKTPVESGEELYVKRGCKGCHSTDGSKVIGPTFLGLYNRESTVLENGSEIQIVADENYIAESINNPKAKLVMGYDPNAMPAFEGSLTESDIDDLIAFIKTLKN